VKDEKKAKFILNKKKEKELEEEEQANGGKPKGQITATKIRVLRREKRAFCRGFS
jgi:hypothetical protein